MERKKYYLGLDIGIASVGWAISSNDCIIDFGVQAWSMPKIKDEGTLASKRRQYRSTTRLRNRKRAQKRRLKKVLCEKVFHKNLPDDKSLGEWVKNLNDKQNVYDLKYDFLFNNKEVLTEKEFAWVLLSYINRRGQETYALKQLLKEEEKEKKEEEKKQEEKNQKKAQKKRKPSKKKEKSEAKIKYESQTTQAMKIWKQGIFPVKNIVEEHKNEEEIFSENQKYKIKNLLYNRESYKNECREIIKKYGIKKEIRKKILDIIFDQFTFEDGPDPLQGKTAKEREQNRKKLHDKLRDQQCKLMEKNNKTKEDFDRIKILRELRVALHHYLPPKEQRGECPYYKAQKRAAEASIIGDCYKFCHEANIKSKIDKSNNKKEFRELINKFFLDPESILGKHFKNVCKFWAYLNEKVKDEEESRIKFFPNLPYFKDIKSLSEDELIQRLGEFGKFDIRVSKIFSDYASLESQYKKWQKLKIKSEKIRNIDDYEKKLYKSFSTSSLSLKIMLEAVKDFITEGKLIGQFLDEKEANLSKIEKKEMPEDLNKTFKIDRLLNSTNKNSTVFRALTNVRKLLINIHKHYRKKLDIPDDERLFETINVEISSSFKHTKRERDRIIDEQRKRREENLMIDEILVRRGMIRNANNRMLLRLYFEQGGKIENGIEISKATCFLTPGWNNIGIQNIVHGELENGHIIPRCHGIDKRIENRFIVFKTANKKQGNNLPLEYINNLNDKKLHDEYINKIKKIEIKGKKKKLLSLSDRNSDEFYKLVNELQEVKINDTRYISRTFINWLATALIKRDYIINGCQPLDKKGNEFEGTYNQWWKEKREEMYNSRINQILGLTTSIIRKQFLFPEPKEFNLNEGTNEGAWGFPNKQKIKELTEWDHAVDGITLSLIHNKAALHFYQRYSNARRIYFDQMHKIRKEKNPDSRSKMFKNLIKEIKEEKESILTYLKKYNIYPNELWLWIINKNFQNIIVEIKNADEDESNDFNIWTPKTINPINESRIKEDIINIIPVKLKWFKINEISYNILQKLLESTENEAKKLIQKKQAMFQILENYINWNEHQRNEFWGKVKAEDKEKKYNDEKDTYGFFRPLFYLFNRQYANKKEQTINKVKDFLKTVIKYVCDEKGKRRINGIVEFFLDYQNSTLINDEDRTTIKEFIHKKKLSNTYLNFTKNIYVDDIDLKPKKVIKYLHDGKIRSMRKLVSSENPLRLGYKKEKIQPKNVNKKEKEKYNYNAKSLEHIVVNKKGENGKQEFLLLKKRIIELRKNYNVEKHKQLNSQLVKYKCMIDKNGSLWQLNEYIGFVFANDGTRRHVTSFHFNEMIKQGKKVVNTNKKEQLVLFGREVYLKNNKKLEKYPIIMKSMEYVELKKVNIRLNGIFWNALKEKRWKEKIGFFRSVKSVKVLEKWQNLIYFNGNIKWN